jgi:hypothetical protein
LLIMRIFLLCFHGIVVLDLIIVIISLNTISS